MGNSVQPDGILRALAERHGDRLRYDPKQPKRWGRWFVRDGPSAPWRGANDAEVACRIGDVAGALGPSLPWRCVAHVRHQARTHPAFAVRPDDREIIRERGRRAFHSGWSGRGWRWAPQPTPEQIAAVFAKAPDRQVP